jgi:hypothetical protein
MAVLYFEFSTRNLDTMHLVLMGGRLVCVGEMFQYLRINNTARTHDDQQLTTWSCNPTQSLSNDMRSTTNRIEESTSYLSSVEVILQFHLVFLATDA